MRALIPIVMALVFAAFPLATAGADNARYAGQAISQERTWNFEQATIPGAQKAGNWGEGVTVAVIDTWVDFRHPDLRERIAGHAVCIASESGCRDGVHDKDRCIHGTHVAGTVASGHYGVAPKARVYAVQVLSYDRATGMCSGSPDDVARGIGFAVAKGADVINLSLGSLVPGLFSNDAVSAAVHDAARAGVVVVFAAGNNTVPVSDDYGSDALLVAATGPDGEIASYSTRGGSVSLAAPGGDDGAAGFNDCSAQTCIRSTILNGAYGLLEGTSMAAPHVSGVAALLLSQVKDRGRADVLRSLQSTARPLAGTRDGLIDATAALGLRDVKAGPVATTSNAVGGPTRRTTRVSRPPAAQPAQPGGATADDDIVRSRSVTFPREAGAATPHQRESATKPGDPSDAQAPRSTPSGGGDSGLPLAALVGGIATVGVIGAVATAFAATQRLRRPKRGSW